MPLAYATLVTSDSYALGALVLSASLRATGTPHALVAMYSPSLTPETLNMLRAGFDRLVPVSTLRSGAAAGDAANLALLGRPDLDITYSKLHAWTLTEYEKVVFLDADVLIMQSVDDLFERDELAAAPDCGWPDIFNSGVFVLRPSQDTFDRLVAFAATRGSWDGGDQGLLNDFFADKWQRLPFVYNVTPTAVYTYAPAFQRFEPDIKVVHFAGPNKPWTYARDADGTPSAKATTPHGSVLHKLISKWWGVFSAHESRWAHLLHPERSQSQGHGHEHGAPQSHHGPSSYSSGAYQSSSNPASALSRLDPSRYSWPEDQLDSHVLEEWKRAMSVTAGGRRRDSFRRRRPSNPLFSEAVHHASHLHESSYPKSPKSPLSTPLSENFAEALGGGSIAAAPLAVFAAVAMSNSSGPNSPALMPPPPGHAYRDGSLSSSPVLRTFAGSPVYNSGDTQMPHGAAPIHFAPAPAAIESGTMDALSGTQAASAESSRGNTGRAMPSPATKTIEPTLPHATVKQSRHGQPAGSDVRSKENKATKTSSSSSSSETAPGNKHSQQTRSAKHVNAAKMTAASTTATTSAVDAKKDTKAAPVAARGTAIKDNDSKEPVSTLSKLPRDSGIDRSTSRSPSPQLSPVVFVSASNSDTALPDTAVADKPSHSPSSPSLPVPPPQPRSPTRRVPSPNSERKPLLPRTITPVSGDDDDSGPEIVSTDRNLSSPSITKPIAASKASSVAVPAMLAAVAVAVGYLVLNLA